MISFLVSRLEFNEVFSSDNGSQAYYTIGANRSQRVLAASTMIWVMVKHVLARI